MAYRSGPYVRIYTPWLDEWIKAGLGTEQLQIMIELCQNVEFHPDGKATAWFSRKYLSVKLGKSENSIRCHVKRLKSLGFIRPVGSARRGTAQVYEIMPEIKWPELRGVSGDPPKRGKGGAGRPHRGVPGDPPNKKTRGASAVPAERQAEPSPDVNVQPEEAPVWRDKHTMPKWEPPKVW